MTTQVDRARAGESTPWGVARPLCGQLHGLFACVTHSVDQFADRVALAGHVDADGLHVIVWRCSEHGPEGGAL